MTSLLDQLCAVVPRPVREKEGTKFWREEDPVLDEEGVVTRGGMWPHQRDWWNLPNFVKALIGGYGSGKTQILCKRAISSALTNAPHPVAVVSPSFPMARETTVPHISGMLEGKKSFYGSRFWWRYHKSLHYFTIRFRGREARISIKSGDDPASLRGPNLAAAYLDEPFLMVLDVFTQMIARVRQPGAAAPEIGLGGTPETLGWVYDLLEGELEEKLDVGSTRGSTRANKALAEAYVLRLLGAFDAKAAQAFVEGHMVNLARGQVYYAFDPTENIIQLPIPSGAELGFGLDFNVNPMAACVFWVHQNHMHVFDEIELPNADTEFLCEVVKEKYWEEGLRDAYPDASGAARSTKAPGGITDFKIIKDAGFNVRATHGLQPGTFRNPLRKDRYNAVNGKFKPRSGRLSLTIAPGCKKLKKYLTTYTHERMNQTAEKAMSHLLDAFSYPVAYLFPVTKEQFRQVKLVGV